MKRVVTRIVAVGLVLGGVAFGLWLLLNLSLGYVFPETVREELSHPVQVSEIREDGLKLADGRLVRVPWIRRLPQGMNLLEDATAQGVEVDEAGYVFGLVRIHHWYGNVARDGPVRRR